MDFLDRASLAPGDSTLVQSQAILFAAALFIACTLFDAQSANARFDELFPSVSAVVKRAGAALAQRKPAAQAVAATASPSRPARR